MALLVFAAVHLAAGILIGTRYRVAALLFAFVAVLLEGIVGDRVFGAAPWWILVLLGCGTLQLGYAAAGAWLSYQGERRKDRSFATAAKKLDRVSGG